MLDVSPRGYEHLSRVERRKLKTKEAIFNAAIELFRQKGFDNTSVEEITEKADVGKGTFFNYFPRKEAILAFLGEKRMAAILKLIERKLNKDWPAREGLKMIFDTLAAENEKDKALVRLVVFESMKREGAVQEVSERREDLCRTFQYLIERGQKKGEFKSEVSAAKAAQILLAIYFQSLLM